MDKAFLRRIAITNSLFKPTSLKQAFDKLKFVQADPIRSPATAQDLIMRHRVKDYSIGDIDKEYINLSLEEDFLYAHGFMLNETWKLMLPRENIELSAFDKKVLKVILQFKEINPKDLIKHFGSKRELNGWGGKSQATRMSLERLHYYGLVRISRRQKGLRIYMPFNPIVAVLNKEERMSRLVMTIIRILAPVTRITLNQSLGRIRRHFGSTQIIIDKLVKSGELITQQIDGIKYFWPADIVINEIPENSVKFLAPFDPVVWDRLRFEHIWEWQYRFEAYVPAPKRIRGYYAMPVLWNDKVIGWVNIGKKGEIDLGFVSKRPKSKRFESEPELEISRIHKFLSI